MRRPVSLRTPSFANLFILNKMDFDKVIVDYPEIQAHWQSRAGEVLGQEKRQTGHKKPNKLVSKVSLINQIATVIFMHI